MKELRDDSAYNFVKVGRDFADAARTLNKHYDNQPFWPTYFVACQGLELYLKAFLRVQGMSVQDLKDKVGHDLQRALVKAKELDFCRVVSLTRDEEDMIRILSPAYLKRDFQYKGSGEWTLCGVDALISFLDRIHNPLLGHAV